MESNDQIDAAKEGEAYSSSAAATLEFDDATLKAIAVVYKNEGDDEFRKLEYNNAIDFYTEGTQVKCKDEELNAKLYSNRATTHYLLGNYNEALSDARSSRVFQPSNMQAIIIGARACVKLNQFGEAITWCNDGLAIDGEHSTLVKIKKESVREQRKVLETDGGTGNAKETGSVMDKGSHFKRPVRYLPLNLDIAEKVGNRKLEGHQYLSLGDSYSETSHFQEAIDSYEEYKRICEKQGDEAGVGHAHGRLGKVYLSVGKSEEARNNFELQLRTAKKVGDRKEEGRAVGNLGSTYLRLFKRRQAMKMLTEHIHISTMLADRSGEGDAYSNRGMLYHMIGDYKRAMEDFSQNLTIVQELDDRAGEGKAYSNLGRVHLKLGDFERALEYHELQLRIAVEEGRMGDEARAYYEMGCNLESLDFEEKTLTFYKLSVLLFNDIRANFRSREISAFKDEWKINLFHEFKNVYTALCRTLLKLNSPLEALWAAEQCRAQALADLLVSRYGILSGEQIRTASDLLKHISTNTVFLEMDTNTIYIWLLKPGQPVHLRKTSWQVENSLKGLIRELRLSKEYKSPREHPNSDPLRILYDIVLSAIADQILDDELVIVPCGQLWLAPLAAIVDPESKYLCESFRIRLAPSLKFLKLIAECPRSYHRESGALIVGDPLIEGRVRHSGRLISFPPLAHARQEAEMIGRLTNSKPLIGSEATKMEVLERLNSAALIHFATHCDSASGDIFLAPPPNPTQTSNILEEKDYTLTMDEVLNINVRAKLVRAKLVNLSCCHSGRGEIKAEGLVGMGRAFLAAGARSVLVSLWAIEDEATFQFMKSFYQHLAEGKKASEALNMAMRCRRESDKFNEIKHWASFVLIGDDVTLDFLHNTSQATETQTDDEHAKDTK